jgi:multiple sugar transport system substrate-binding protein
MRVWGSPPPTGLSRRAFLRLGAAVAGATTLGGCAGAAAEPANGLTFWDQIWGSASYTAAARALTEAYAPPPPAAPVSYQSIPWANFVQTYSAAVASRTGPAVSSGAGYQALQFFKYDAILPADDVLARLDTQDFLPGTIEPLRYQGSQVAVPWQLDIRALHYRRSVLERAGVSVPTDWDGLREACIALRRVGVSGFGMAAGASTTLGSHQILAMMYNNGGGLFAPDGQPDCVTERNIETLEFLKELSAIGAIDPRFTSYTADNFEADLGSGKIGMAFTTPGIETNLPSEVRDDVLVASPLVGPHGDLGTIYWVNNLMMYTDTPSPEQSEAFLAYYLDNMRVYWRESVITALPVRRSIIEMPEFQANTNSAKIAAEWVPVGKTQATLATTLFPALNAIDGGQALARFAQQVVRGEEDPRSILEDLQRRMQVVVR